MRLEVRNFNAREPQDYQHTPRIMELSREEAMIPITRESILKHQLSCVAVDLEADTEQFAGYAAITHIYSKDVVELGALVTAEEYRGTGVARRLIQEVNRRVHETWGDSQIIAFTNEASRILFSKMGGFIIENPDVLPREVWKLCQFCTSYQQCVVELGQRCCGRVVDITNILVEDGAKLYDKK